MKNLSLRLLFFMLTALPFYSQNTTSISGTVKTAKNTALYGVEITILTNSKTTLSDKNGEFQFNDLGFETYTLQLNYMGFVKQQVTVALTNDNPSATLQIVMEEQTSVLQAVEITGRNERSYRDKSTFGATKTATAIKDIPQAVSIVTKEVIADQQVFRLGEITKNLSGVNNVSFYDAYTLRGFELGSQTGSLINGLQTVGIFGPQPLLVNIERVEVIKGPASALYGNANPGGSLNSVTKKPLDEERKAVSFTTGSFNTTRATLDFTGPLNDSKTFLYRLNLGHENADSFRNLQENKSFVVAPSVSFIPSDKTRINFELVLTQQEGKLDRGQPIQGAFGPNSNFDLFSTPTALAIGQTNDFHKNDYGYVTTSFSHKLTEKISLNASYLRFNWEEDLQEHRTENAFARDNTLNGTIDNLVATRAILRQQQLSSQNLTTYFVFDDLKTGPLSHKIVAGYDYIEQKQEAGGSQNSARRYKLADGGTGTFTFENQEDFDTNSGTYLFDEDGLPVPNVPHFNINTPEYAIANLNDYSFNSNFSIPQTKYFTNGVYVQDQIKWKKLQVLLGLRYESYIDVAGYKTEAENKIEQTKLLPRLGAVYSVTDDINVYGTYATGFQPQSIFFVNNPDAGGPFDPESSNMIEFGAKGEFFNKHLLATLATYQITKSNILVASSDVTSDILEQAGEVRSRGVELDVSGSITPELSVVATYAYNNTEITEDNDPTQVGERPYGTPEHQGSFWARYSFSQSPLSGLGVGLGMNYVSKQTSVSKEFFLPDYTVFDAALFYNIKKIRLALTVNNLADKTYWVGALNATRLFPAAPRNYLLNVAYTF